MTLRSRFVVLSLGMSLVAGPAAQSAVPAGPPSARVDQIFRAWHAADSPGAAVLIVERGEVLLAKGYGMASLEHGIPIRTTTVFDIASVSKQFGAMAIALLEAEGRLSLSDEVRRYIPELPDFGHRITIRHLVHHTSGIRDWPGTFAAGGWDYEDVISFEQILRMAFNQRDLNFAPGEAYSYSNTGYNLLAEVVARVSGQTFREFTDARIFRPLGMTQSHFQNDRAEVVPGRAESYRPGPYGRFQRVASNLTALGSSSLLTTIDDLAKWIDNLHSPTPTVGSAAVIARIHEQGVLNSGERIAYAFGHSIGEYRGLRTVTHTGSWAGYRSVLQRFPDQRFAVAILANAANMNPSALASDLADIYLADRLGPPVAAVVAGGGSGETTSAWKPSSAELQAYAGEYRSAELQTSYVLDVRDGTLVARHFRTGERLLRPAGRDRFQAPGLGEFSFRRGAGGSVEAFTITVTSDRVRNLRFDRVKP